MNSPERVEQAKAYHEKIRELEIQFFPELTESDIYAAEGVKYFYFAPSWYFKLGLITETDVKSMISGGKTLLSVGAGPAYLERALVNFGMPKQNIVLSDIDAESMPSDFESKTFDMYADWTGLEGTQFDLIFFPESTLINVRFKSDKDGQSALLHLITESVKHLKTDGEMRMTHNLIPELDIEPVKRMVLKENPGVQITYSSDILSVTKTSPVIL